MKRIILPLILLLLLGVTSCKKEVDPIYVYTDQQRARDYLYRLMKEWYFWYKEMPVVNPTDYSDPYEILEALRYSPTDRWSYVADFDEFNAYYQGSFAGHGIVIILDGENKARIAQIYKRSPLYAEDVRRGWIVESVNGVDIAALMVAGNYAEYNNVMGPRQAGITNDFKFRNPLGEIVEISSTKAEFMVNSVLKYDILDLSTGKTGYLAFDSFIETSFDELEEAFTLFVANDIKQLILDLRYNSGGMLDVAIDLSSYTAGNDEADNLFIKVVHNDKRSNENSNIFFKETGYSLDIQKLAVITTRATASASEIVINGLVPYVDVKCFGDKTSGKPVGMYAFPDEKNKYYFLPITFQLLNAQNYGDYFNGIEPHTYVSDDLTRDFGDPEELSLKAVIEYLETGSTKSVLPYQAKPQIFIDERPDWQKNIFIRRIETER
jgi:C-terminal processing protease CtpA/Prc